MTERRHHTEHPGRAEQHVEPTPALVDRRAEAIDRRQVFEIDRHQGRRAAPGANLVVQFLQPPDSTGDGNDMGARLGQAKRGGTADAARCASDDGDPSEQWLRHPALATCANSTRFSRGALPSRSSASRAARRSKSVSRIG